METAPVALFFFNRPAVTFRVLDRIRQARPSRLYLVSDGPRGHVAGEAATVEGLRQEVVKTVDWRPELVTIFAEENLGCSRRMASGIEAVLAREPAAIFLEDDCLPAPSFFGFATRLLDRHREDQQCMSVSGTNLATRLGRGTGYRACHFPMIWGWATWARAWKGYRRVMDPGDDSFLDELAAAGKIPGFLPERWHEMYSVAAKNPDFTWDYQFIFHCMRAGGWSLFPETNLIANLGHGADATHTKGTYTPFSSLRLGAIDFDAVGTAPSRCDLWYDRFFQHEYLFGLTSWRNLPYKVAHKLNAFWSKFGK